MNALLRRVRKSSLAISGKLDCFKGACSDQSASRINQPSDTMKIDSKSEEIDDAATIGKDAKTLGRIPMPVVGHC